VSRLEVFLKEKPYLGLGALVERLFIQYGNSVQGVDADNEERERTRFQIILDFIQPPPPGEKVAILDFGCGAARFLNFINEHRLPIDYQGCDISEKMIAYCRGQYPSHRFYCQDILQTKPQFSAVDYVIINGVFTAKYSLTFSEMDLFFQSAIRTLLAFARKGIIFNARGRPRGHDDERFFIIPPAQMAEFLKAQVSSNILFRNDYHPYEYYVAALR
jgi:SAM-dependent methyltransferase